MTREEFDTTKWYRGIKVRDLMTEREFVVSGVDFERQVVSFWDINSFGDGRLLRALPCKLVEIVEE